MDDNETVSKLSSANDRKNEAIELRAKAMDAGNSVAIEAATNAEALAHRAILAYGRDRATEGDRLFQDSIQAIEKATDCLDTLR
jgi:hypothetical protein